MRRFCLSMAMLALFTSYVSAQKPLPAVQSSALDSQATLQSRYGQFPLNFEANQGQVDDQVKFTSHGRDYSLFLTAHEAVLSLTRSNVQRSRTDSSRSQAANDDSRTDVLRMQFAGMQAGVQVSGEDKLSGIANYFIGNDATKWHENIPTYAKVKYTGVYPGVDLVYYGNQQQLEYDFVVAPNADPKQVKLRFAGATRLILEADGNLSVIAANGRIAFHKPVVYQERNGGRETVDGRFTLLAADTIGFVLGAYDKDRKVTIDPVLVYSTYVGPGNSFGIAVDAAGSAYVGGFAGAVNFPTTPGAFQPVSPYAGPIHGPIGTPIFVAKMNAAGTALVYSTYITGTSAPLRVDYQASLAVDSSGLAYITGNTEDPTFPVTANAYQPICSRLSGTTTGCLNNAFVTVLNASGSALLYSTYLGGSTGSTKGSGIAVDATGRIYISGTTTATDFPILNGFQTTLGDTKGLCQDSVEGDLFLTRFDRRLSGASSLNYSTYIGGSGAEVSLNSLAVDNKGDAYLTGGSSSVDYPVTSSGYQNSCGVDGNCNGAACVMSGGVSVLTKIDTTKSGIDSLAYSTFLSGGKPGDSGVGIAADDQGDVFITGTTLSKDFPTTMSAISTCHVGKLVDSFVSKLDTKKAGTASLVYSTCLGGSSGEASSGIALDRSGSAYVIGSLSALHKTYPLVTPIQVDGSGFISKLNPDGTSYVWSTRFGGTSPSDDLLAGGLIALGPADGVFITFSPRNPDYPTTAGTYDPICNPVYKLCSSNSTAAAVTKISQGHGDVATLNPLNPTFAETEIGKASRPAQIVVLRDVGDEPYNINSITLSGADAADFSQTNTCSTGTFGPASNCSITIRFTPSATGARTATLTIDDTAPGSPHIATISGIGDLVDISPSKLKFPAIAISTNSQTQSITVTNVATARLLNFDGISVVGDFSETDTCAGFLNPNASCTILVTFSPTAAGTQTGKLTISDDDENGHSYTQVVRLSGIGTSN